MGQTVASGLLAENICTNPSRVRRVLAKLKKAGLVQTKEGRQDGGYGTAVDAEAYIDCLYTLCDTSRYFHGFCQFHLSYLIAALKKKRRYKEVMKLMEETKFS